MAGRSRGRAVAAAFGLFVLLAGLVGGGVLFVVSEERPSQAVEGFARAPIGCTTTLDFTETGTFYVYEETGSTIESAAGGCEPTATAPEFGVVFDGERQPASITRDPSIAYDVDGFVGRSVQRLEITERGEYAVSVTGADLAVVAALGRDPQDGVDDVRQLAAIAAIGGAVVGLLLLTIAGRRSKRAARARTAESTSWEHGLTAPPPQWPPATPHVSGTPEGPRVDLPSDAAGAPPMAEQSPPRESPSAPDRPPTPPTWGAPVGEPTRSSPQLPPPGDDATRVDRPPPAD